MAGTRCTIVGRNEHYTHDPADTAGISDYELEAGSTLTISGIKDVYINRVEENATIIITSQATNVWFWGAVPDNVKIKINTLLIRQLLFEKAINQQVLDNIQYENPLGKALCAQRIKYRLKYRLKQTPAPAEKFQSSFTSQEAVANKTGGNDRIATTTNGKRFITLVGGKKTINADDNKDSIFEIGNNTEVEINGDLDSHINNIGAGSIIRKTGYTTLHVDGDVGEDVIFDIPASARGRLTFAKRPSQNIIDAIQKSDLANAGIMIDGKLQKLNQIRTKRSGILAIPSDNMDWLTRESLFAIIPYSSPYLLSNNSDIAQGYIIRITDLGLGLDVRVNNINSGAEIYVDDHMRLFIDGNVGKNVKFHLSNYCSLRFTTRPSQAVLNTLPHLNDSIGIYIANKKYSLCELQKPIANDEEDLQFALQLSLQESMPVSSSSAGLLPPNAAHSACAESENPPSYASLYPERLWKPAASSSSNRLARPSSSAKDSSGNFSVKDISLQEFGITLTTVESNVLSDFIRIEKSGALMGMAFENYLRQLGRLKDNPSPTKSFR